MCNLKANGRCLCTCLPNSQCFTCKDWFFLLWNRLSSLYFVAGNGKRVSGTSGNVTFVPVNAPSGLQHGSWLIQIPSVETVYLSLVNPPSCDKDDITQLSVFQGSTANGVRVDRICKSDSFKPVLLALKGPFVTLILVTAQLQQSGFFIRFDVNRAGKLIKIFVNYLSYIIILHIFVFRNSHRLTVWLCFLRTSGPDSSFLWECGAREFPKWLLSFKYFLLLTKSCIP